MATDIARKEMQPEIKAVYDAVMNQGAYPPYHQEQILRLKREWPVLWEALSKLVWSVDKEIVRGRISNGN